MTAGHACNDPVKSRSRHNRGNDVEFEDGRRYETLECQRKSVLVLDVIEGNITVAEANRQYPLGYNWRSFQRFPQIPWPDFPAKPSIHGLLPTDPRSNTCSTSDPVATFPGVARGERRARR